MLGLLLLPLPLPLLPLADGCGEGVITAAPEAGVGIGVGVGVGGLRVVVGGRTVAPGGGSWGISVHFWEPLLLLAPMPVIAAAGCDGLALGVGVNVTRTVCVADGGRVVDEGRGVVVTSTAGFVAGAGVTDVRIVVIGFASGCSVGCANGRCEEMVGVGRGRGACGFGLDVGADNTGPTTGVTGKPTAPATPTAPKATSRGTGAANAPPAMVAKTANVAILMVVDLTVVSSAHVEVRKESSYYCCSVAYYRPVNILSTTAHHYRVVVSMVIDDN